MQRYKQKKKKIKKTEDTCNYGGQRNIKGSEKS